MVLQLLRNRRTGSTLLWLILGVFLFFSILAGPIFSAEEEIAVIVNKTGPLTSIPDIEIREIYLGEMRFIKGQPVIPLHAEEGPIKNRFLSSIVHQSSRQHKLHWTKKVFQEGLMLPLVKSNPREIVEWIKENPGAIGYVPKELADQEEDIQIIKVLKDTAP